MKGLFYGLLDMATDWPIGTFIFGFVLVCVIIVVGIIFEIVGSHSETLHVTVIEKSYAPYSSGVGVGPSVGGNGGVALVVTSTPEKHILFVRQGGGEPFPVTVDRNTWLSAEKGAEIDIIVLVGWITGTIID